jgi:hypothetical protein
MEVDKARGDAEPKIEPNMPMPDAKPAEGEKAAEKEEDPMAAILRANEQDKAKKP